MATKETVIRSFCAAILGVGRSLAFTLCSRRQFRIFVVAVFALIVGLVEPQGAIAGGDAPGRYTYDLTPVEFTVHGHRFRVPKAYVYSVKPNQVEQTSIGLQAFLPNVEPISEANHLCFIQRGTCDRVALIEISGTRLPPLPERALGMFREGVAKPAPGPYGLLTYDYPQITKASDVFGVTLPNGEFYSISCQRSGQFANCTYRENLGSDVSLRYSFRRSQLEHWEEIHNNMMAVIASFQRG